MSRAPSVLIVGAGFGGVAVALELMRHGQDNLTILEKADDLGGVWRDNTYPGAACDAPSDLYSYSFAPNAQWPKRFANSARSSITSAQWPPSTACSIASGSAPRWPGPSSTT